MERNTTLREFYLMYENEELDNQIITFDGNMNKIVLSYSKLGDIYDESYVEFGGSDNLEYKMMKSYVKWFRYDKLDNKFYICLVYEDWMKDYKGK